MAKGETKKTNQMLDRSYQQSNAGYNQFFNNFQPNNMGQTRTDSDALRNSIIGRYNTSTLPQRNSMGWFDLPGSKVMDPNGNMVDNPNSDMNMARQQFGQAGAGYRDMARTGGFDPNHMRTALTSYSTFTGPNGGFSNADLTGYRQSATAAVPSFYKGMMDDMARRRVLQGGYSPGFDAQTAEATREMSRQGYKAGIDADAAIMGMKQQGRMFGTQGFANVANQLAGLEQQGRATGLGGMLNTGQGYAGLGNQELGAQLQMMGMAENSDINRIGGMADMYRSAPGNVGMDYNTFLEALRGRDAGNQGYLGARYQANPQTDWFGRGMGLLGGIGGLATGIGAYRMAR